MQSETAATAIAIKSHDQKGRSKKLKECIVMPELVHVSLRQWWATLHQGDAVTGGIHMDDMDYQGKYPTIKTHN